MTYQDFIWDSVTYLGHIFIGWNKNYRMFGKLNKGKCSENNFGVNRKPND